jgi:hypothetical protein
VRKEDRAAYTITHSSRRKHRSHTVIPAVSSAA